MLPRLLLAHADDFLVEPLSRFFGRHGFHVESTNGGVDCIAKLRSFAPDVLVLDWDLPWGGGDGVLALLRGDWHDLAVPIVLLVPADAAQQVTWQLPPVVQCLTKPFHVAHLLLDVQNVVSGHHRCADVSAEPTRVLHEEASEAVTPSA